ncbi:anti-sigma factor [Paenibacillus sp. OV219]|uniref:anti-sigma factor n=1 Tax=Paenibacillus sp. OV219 TaxID=1884377 RepID=UPI0008AABE05|nr:anti-sigma factor [Paenibacillus sp. OV219]SEN56869.1 Anti-sigma-K factor RskA [Paenibacillus sp. OV219]
MEKREQQLPPACELCLEYVSDACNAEEKAAFELHLPHCEACQQELQELRTVWEALPTDIHQIEPPPDLKQQVMDAALAAQPADNGRSLRHSAARRRRSLSRKLTPALLTAAVAGLVLMGAWNWQLRSEQLRAPLPVEQALNVSAAQIKELVPLQAAGKLAGKSSGVACIVDNGQSRQFVVYLFGAGTTTGSEAYQVWLVKDGVRKSAGTFRVGPSDRGVGLLAMPMESAKLDFDSIGITIEPDDKGDQPRGTKVYGSSV